MASRLPNEAAPSNEGFDIARGSLIPLILVVPSVSVSLLVGAAAGFSRLGEYALILIPAVCGMLPALCVLSFWRRASRDNLGPWEIAGHAALASGFSAAMAAMLAASPFAIATVQGTIRGDLYWLRPEIVLGCASLQAACLWLLARRRERSA